MHTTPAMMGQATAGAAWRACRTFAVGVVACVVLAACTTGFVYNRLHWAVSWYVNGLVSLDEPQEQQLRDLVRETMAWHRQTQLPRYVALLDELDRQTDGAMTPENIEDRYQEMTALFDAFLQQIIPGAASLLNTLSPEQVEELAGNLEESNEELWEEFAGATAEKRQERRVRNAIRILQRFTGHLDAGQRAGIEASLSTMQDLSGEWMDRRRHWQARFLDLLSSEYDAGQFESALRDLALNPNQFDTAAYRQGVEQNHRVIVRMLADVVNGLNSRQREHLGRKFVEYRDDLQDIMTRG